MKFFERSRRLQLLCLTAIILLCSIIGAIAQTPAITITSLPNNVYKIGTSNLNSDDLVFYRFSDGYEQTAMATTTNSDASVQRQFKTGSVKVSGFIARKNGPIDFASGDVNNPTCASCAVPAVGLVPGECIRLRNTSWDAFVDPANPTALVDPKTTPFCTTPTLPWFFLPVTMKAQQANSYAEINIPSGMTIMGAVVKGNWKEVFVGQNIFPITDPDVQNFIYLTSDKIKMNLTSSYNNEFNVYFIVKSNTTVGQQSTFTAQMYDHTGNAQGQPSGLKLYTHHNPHDPNVLIALQQTTCFLHTDNAPLDYKVEFQNLGAGVAEIVDVMVKINPRALDASSLTSDMITSSFPLTSFQATQDAITFRFKGINLAGLNQDPQPSFNDTRGWVQFSINTQPCIPHSLVSFSTQAFVTFTGNHGTFVETIATNETWNEPSECLPPDMACALDKSAGAILQDPLLSTKCYPSFFQEMLHVETPAAEENGLLTITMSDLSGRIWVHNVSQTPAGTDTKKVLDTSALPAGMYLVQVRAGKEVQVFKVIKE